MNIKTVALIGAGAVGSYMLWGLSEKLGENLWVVAEGERRMRLLQEGLYVNEQPLKLHVKTPKEAHGADLAVVCTKYGDLQDVQNMLTDIVEEHTIVLSLMNGVDSEEIIGNHIGMEHMLYGLIKIASSRKGNHVWFDSEKTLGIVYGSAEEGTAFADEACGAVEALFADTPLKSRKSKEILKEIWQKYAFNVSYNLPQAILGCGVGVYRDSIYAAKLRDHLRDEVCAVAAARGIDISERSDIEKMDCPSAPQARYSTLQDLDAKRRTEIEMFAGTMIRLGKETGVLTPYNEFAYLAIKALEEKNQGMFEYL